MSSVTHQENALYSTETGKREGKSTNLLSTEIRRFTSYTRNSVRCKYHQNTIRESSKQTVTTRKLDNLIRMARCTDT